MKPLQIQFPPAEPFTPPGFICEQAALLLAVNRKYGWLALPDSWQLIVDLMHGGF